MYSYNYYVKIMLYSAIVIKCKIMASGHISTYIEVYQTATHKYTNCKNMH